MNIITAPIVSIFSKPTFISNSDYVIPNDGDDFTKIGSFAAKGCYDSYGDSGRPNIENQKSILEHRHGSVLEHIVIGLHISGITRGLSLELNRHRTFSISQRSTRYTKEEESNLVLEPYYASLYKKYEYLLKQDTIGVYVNKSEINVNGNMELQLLLNHLNSAFNSFESYKSEVKILESLNPENLIGFDLRKWARGKARNILPHGLETQGCWSNNVRGWRWFIECRSDIHAEPEIRRLAYEIYKILRFELPVYFEDFKESEDDIPQLTTEYHKI